MEKEQKGSPNCATLLVRQARGRHEAAKKEEQMKTKRKKKRKRKIKKGTGDSIQKKQEIQELSMEKEQKEAHIAQLSTGNI